jgi:ABC-2 type transport system ATP-binding protein
MLAISMENLTKIFPATQGLEALLWPKRSGWVEALKGISLKVEKGEIFGLLGPNGGGKTTLLEILATYLLPTSGRAWVNGHDLVREPLPVRHSVGYCPAGSRGFDLRLSGKRNLKFFALLSQLPRVHARDQIEKLWELVGLHTYKDVPVAHYSDGMRKRLALAKTLLTDPPILLLDEPTQGLDPEASGFWNRFLREQVVGKMGKTILLVTHNLIEARNTCDRIAILDRGIIVTEGKVNEVLDRR